MTDSSRDIFDNAADFGLQLYSSFPKEEMATVIGLVQGQSTPLAAHVGRVLPVRHVVSHRQELVDKETGEVTSGDRIILVTSAGEAFATVSAGVRRSIALYMQLNGKPPWTPPLNLVLEEVPLPGGRKTFQLNLAK